MDMTYAAPDATTKPSLIRQLGRDSAYLLTGMPIAIVVFTLLVTGFSVGAGMLVTVLGLPILVATMFIARGFADIERLRLRLVFGEPMPRPRYKRPPDGAGFWRRMFGPLGDGQSWLDWAHGTFAILPVSTATWSIAVTWWSGALGGITYPIWARYLPIDPDDTDLPQILGLGRAMSTRYWFYFLVGVAFALTLPFMMRAMALIQGWIGRAMLTGVAAMQQRIAGLEESRDAAVSAEAGALRRLERDIHDGPQQRLVRLAMELGRVERQLARDPDAARATLAEAVTQTREALSELRALSRGIAPPILADRGLTAAITALAGQSVVPVTLDVPDLPRLPDSVENTAYFVVAEALANVNKHSGATVCRISLSRRPGDPDGSPGGTGRLLVLIEDDGMGGAHTAKGHGLAGLTDRVRAVDGVLAVHSPPGGPTRIVAELLCP